VYCESRPIGCNQSPHFAAHKLADKLYEISYGCPHEQPNVDPDKLAYELAHEISYGCPHEQPNIISHSYATK